jgi:hypothetical protein
MAPTRVSRLLQRQLLPRKRPPAKKAAVIEGEGSTSADKPTPKKNPKKKSAAAEGEDGTSAPVKKAPKKRAAPKAKVEANDEQAGDYQVAPETPTTPKPKPTPKRKATNSVPVTPDPNSKRTKLSKLPPVVATVSEFEPTLISLYSFPLQAFICNQECSSPISWCEKLLATYDNLERIVLY